MFAFSPSFFPSIGLYFALFLCKYLFDGKKFYERLERLETKMLEKYPFLTHSSGWEVGGGSSSDQCSKEALDTNVYIFIRKQYKLSTKFATLTQNPL